MLALEIQMEWLVEQGYLLNIGLALTLLAIICKVIPGIVMEHLLKDTEYITLTKGKYIQNFKNRVEQIVSVDRQVNDTGIFVEKYLRRKRFLWINLRNMCQFSLELMVLSVGVHIFGAVYAAIMDMSANFILWSSVVPIFSLLLYIVTCLIVDYSYKYEWVKINMQNFVENEYKNHLKSQKEAKEELQKKESLDSFENTKERKGEEFSSLSPAEQRVIQEVIREFL